MPDLDLDLDLLELAEDVAFGRRSLDNVIDQIAVAVPDGRARRRAVSEVETLILGLTGVRAHARATAEVAAASSESRPTVATDLVVEPRRVRARGGVFGGAGAFAAGLTAIAGVVIVAVVLASLRPGSGVGGPSPSVPAGGVSPSPHNAGASPAAPGSPDIALWATGVTAGRITIWRWSPAQGSAVRHWLDVDTWPAGTFETQVVASPDGSRIAISEFGGPSSSLSRTRVIDAAGKLLWTSPINAAPAIDLAWSPDGTRLALGAIPTPWTVVSFGADGASAQVLPLPADRAFRLIGFSADAAQLIGYETSGEAGFADKPVAMDLATGAIAPIAEFPAGMTSNATTDLDRINPATGAALTTTGGAKGARSWVVRTAAGDAPLATASEPTGVAWAGDTTIVEVGPATVSTPAPPPRVTAVPAGSFLGVWRVDPGTGTPQQIVAFANADRAAAGGWSFTGRLLGARDGVALVAIGGPPCCVPADNREGAERVWAVDLDRQQDVEARLPADARQGTLLNFAGWLPASQP